MGFLSKMNLNSGFLGRMKKAPSAVQPEAEYVDNTRNAQVMVEKIGCNPDKDVGVADNTDSFREAKAKALSNRKIHHAGNEPGLHDFWPTLKDNKSSSYGSVHTESSSERTENSLFTAHKLKLKTTVGQLAKTITERLNSPPSTPYETLDEGSHQDKPEILAHVQRKSFISADLTETVTEPEKPVNQGMTKTQVQSDKPYNEDLANTLIRPKNPKETEEYKDEPFTAEGRPNAQTEFKKYSLGLAKKDIADDDKERANGEEPKARAAKLPKESTRNIKRKKTRWRSAIDAATGRTYYYVKGTQKVTWEKPFDL